MLEQHQDIVLSRRPRTGKGSNEAVDHRHRHGGRAGFRPDRPPPPADARETKDVARLWGSHAVSEALRSPHRKLLRLMATHAAAEVIAPLAAARGLSIEVVSPDAITGRVPRDAVHQGLLLDARPLEPIEIDDIPEGGTVLVLDQLTDPHNVGAILRTAAAFGVSALVMTDRHAPPFSGTLAKAASGGLEHVPVALVVNLARALDELGQRGFFRIGLDSEGEASIEQAVPKGAVALVLGAEGTGLRRLTRERCDLLARLDLPGPIRSLNVSNACAAALTVLKLRPTNAQ